MHSPSGWNNRQRRSIKAKTANNIKAIQERPPSESVNRVSVAEESHNCRRPHNRAGLSRRRKGWSSPSDGGSVNCFVKPWSPHDGLRRWKETGKQHCRYFCGAGSGQVLLERDVEEGIWKVMTVPGYRFSPLWLDAIRQWATEYQEALLELNKESKLMDSSVSKARSNQTHLKPLSLTTQEDTPSTQSAPDQRNNDCPDFKQDRIDERDRRSRRQGGMGQYSRSGAVHRVRSFFNGKIRISLRCERMGLTDVEMDMISKWHRQNSSVLSIVKLWLFDNKITDSGARHIAQMVNDELLEIHVSHNSMTNSGAQQIMAAATSTRKASSKPFWLRMEWNMINHNELKEFIAEMEKEKGMVVDIPRFHLRRSKGKASSCLINERKVAHLRLPWIQCQRLSPSEAPVLMQAKTSWQKNSNEKPKDRAAPSPNNGSVQPSNLGSFQMKKPNHPNASHQGNSGGPLLIFPDTSALLGLIGCKVKTGCTPFMNFEWLDGLCQKNNFGRCLPANERVFFVLCDSVMKQLDGLKKHSAHVGLCVRKLVNSGLEKYGPAGQDFLTILGAHEGEGIIVDRNAEVLDSRSHHVFNKGQAIDLKIVEVALFFQQELCCAATQFRLNAEESQMTDQHPNPNNPFCFPVVLFSNDNVQLMAAKSHGLPAFRYTDLQKCTHSREVMHGRKPLTASVLRSLIGKKATVGLGARARKSLQDEFDGIVACMKHLMESYEDARNLLGQTKEILEGNSEDALTQLKQLLDVGQQHGPQRRRSDKTLKARLDSESSSADNTSEETEEDLFFGMSLEDGGDESSPATTTVESDDPKLSDSSLENTSTGDLDDSSDGETIPLVRAKLAEWEGLVKSYQNPSRILRWTSGHLYSD